MWQCQPCCARARSLAAAPLPGLPSCLSGLVTGPSFDPRSQDPTNLGCAGEKTDAERAQRDLTLQLGAAWHRGSRAGWDTLPALPSSFWFFSTPPRTFGSGIFPLESLPAMLEMALGESSALAPSSPLWDEMGFPPARAPPLLPHPHIPWGSSDGMGAAGWIPHFLEEDDAPALLQPCAAVMPPRFSMGIWTEALQTHFLPRARPLMGTGLAQGHLARLPNVRSSTAPRCSRGPSCPPCAAPVCSFLMSSKSRMEPGPFSPWSTSEAHGGAGSHEMMGTNKNPLLR